MEKRYYRRAGGRFIPCEAKYATHFMQGDDGTLYDMPVEPHDYPEVAFDEVYSNGGKTVKDVEVDADVFTQTLLRLGTRAKHDLADSQPLKDAYTTLDSILRNKGTEKPFPTPAMRRRATEQQKRLFTYYWLLKTDLDALETPDNVEQHKHAKRERDILLAKVSTLTSVLDIFGLRDKCIENRPDDL
jgi:hypothetical protein